MATEAHAYEHRRSALYLEQFGFGSQSENFYQPQVLLPQAHETYENRPSITERRHWALALGNAAVALPELAMATIRQAGAGAWDALHNAFDVMGYLKQLRLIGLASGESHAHPKVPTGGFSGWSRLKSWLLQTKESDEAKLEKASFAWISFPAIGAAAIAGAGIIRELQGGGEQSHVDWTDWAHMGVTGSALVLAFGLWRAGAGMKQKLQTRHETSQNLIRHVENFHSHAKLDAASSGVALIEAVAHTAGHGTLFINAITLALAGYQTWRFWPSRVRKQAYSHEIHHGHDHDAHDSCGHAHLVPHEAGDVMAKLRQRTRAIGSIASSFLQERQAAKLARREQEHELRWWRWVLRVSESREPLASWAERQLQSIPQETLRMLIRRD